MGRGGYYDPETGELTTYPIYNENEETCGNCRWWESTQAACRFGTDEKQARDYCSEGHFSHK